MNAILCLAMKDLRLLWRDKLGLFWVLGFPLIMALFFGAIFGGGGGETAAMKVAIADEDGTAGSRAFTDKLRSSAALEISESDAATALQAVRRGDLVAFIRLEKGFGDAFTVFGGTSSPIEMGIDPARRAEAGFLQGLLMEASFASLQSKLADPAAMRERVRTGLSDLEASPPADPKQADVLKNMLGSLDTFLGAVDPDTYRKGLPGGSDDAAAGTDGSASAGATTPSIGGSGGIRQVHITTEESGPRTYFEVSFPAAITWGLLGCASAFALSLVRERISGTYLRLRAAPLSWAQLLAGKGLACFIACTVATTLMLIFGHVMFAVRLENMLKVALAVICASACVVGMMMLLSTAGRTIQAVSGVSWGFFVVMEMIGGGMIPLIAMPKWMLTLSHLSPVKWIILALEGAIWRGFSFAEMALPCGILLAVGIACFALGVLMLARQRG